MSDPSASPPRRQRNPVAPPAVLDPYVTDLLRWIEAQDNGVNPNTMARQAAANLDWPLPFAEAVVTAARGRRLLTLLDITVRGGDRAGLSGRGREWVAQLDVDEVEATR
jgi:hypothetical protein